MPVRSMLGWLQQWTCLKARVVLCKFVCSNVYICAFIYLFIINDYCVLLLFIVEPYGLIILYIN